MRVKQISVFLENKSGRLADVTRTLAQNQINIKALSIADTTDFGILRLIVNKPEQAEKVLSDNGFTVSATDVVAIAVSDVPGGLSTALEVLEKDGIGIEYMYAFVGKQEEEALVILRVENHAKAIQLLQANHVKVLTSQVIADMD